MGNFRFLSILLNKPWALIDDEIEIQKLIFKKDKGLYLSKNGIVQEGKWEYLPEANSLFIDRKYDKLLCNIIFIDHAVMVLKIDGTKNHLFVLTNQNRIPNLNAIDYLKDLRIKKLEILNVELDSGHSLEVLSGKIYNRLVEGLRVRVNTNLVKDGKYKAKHNNTYILIKNSRIEKLLKEKKYSLNNEINVVIHQRYNHIVKGDEVFINGSLIENNILDWSRFRWLYVIDGKVHKFVLKHPKYWFRQT